jgi:S-adenosylmethionine-diacylglycerol 3-amino-3-carboxypropyl transferase
MSVKTPTGQPTDLFKRVRGYAHDLCFKGVHGHRLIYNACWEDPRLDREVMKLDSASRVAMITSAGCNALDYLLDDPGEIHTIDLNSRQNAVLQLKIVLFQLGLYDELFALFGRGVFPQFSELYRMVRDHLPEYARSFWKNKAHYFAGGAIKGSFYFHGASGDVAWLARSLFFANRKIRRHLMDLIEAGSLAEQRAIYAKLEPEVWNWACRALISSPLIMAMIGVPRPQTRLIEQNYPGAMLGFVKDKLRHVFTEVDIRDNYFWRVYLTGSYTETCCPNYLKRGNFDVLRDRVDRIQSHCMSVATFLTKNRRPFTHYVLLDHQDWMAYHAHDALEEEWRQILRHSRRGTKILLRSAGLNADFLPARLADKVKWHPARTEALHRQDRVGTYGSFHYATVS